MKRPSALGLACLLVGIWHLAFGIFACAIARSDELVLGSVAFGKVEQIVTVDGRRGTITLVYQGRQMTQSLAGFQSLEMAAYPQLGQAFAAARGGDFATAARLFRYVQRHGREEWLTTLLDGQLVGVLDRGGQFTDAVEAYIRWVNSGWIEPKVSPPTSMPDAASPELGAAAKTLEAAAVASTDEAARFRLRSLLLRVYQKRNDPRLADLAGELARQAAAQTQPAGPDDTGLSVRDQCFLAPIRQAVVNKEFALGLSRAGAAGPDVSRDALGTLFMLAGECYQGCGDRERAGLCYMRVVVHFPADRQAAEALWRAGQIHEALGRPDVAARLYDTLVQRYPSSPQAGPARAAMAGLAKGRQ